MHIIIYDITKSLSLPWNGSVSYIYTISQSINTYEKTRQRAIDIKPPIPGKKGFRTSCLKLREKSLKNPKGRKEVKEV